MKYNNGTCSDSPSYVKFSYMLISDTSICCVIKPGHDFYHQEDYITLERDCFTHYYKNLKETVCKI